MERRSMTMDESRLDTRTDLTDADSSVRVGIDVGGTKTLCVAVGTDGRILAQVRRPTGRGGGQVVDGVVDIVAATLHEAGLAPEHANVEGIGVGIPGTVDRATGRVTQAVNLGADEIDLGAALVSSYGVRVVVENDVNAAAMGAWGLNGCTPADAAFLNLGTGVAAGFIVDGQLVHGSSGVAGEIGHMVIDPSGPMCGCGQRGCAEAIISGPAVARAWPTEEPYPIVDLLEKAEDGDLDAMRVRDTFAMGIARTVQLMTLATDPAVVMIGGGVANAGQPLLDCVRKAIDGMEDVSPFLASLNMGRRLRLVDGSRPVGAIGAALLVGLEQDACDATAVTGTGFVGKEVSQPV